MGGFEVSAEGFLWYFIDWYNKNVADSDVPTITKPDVYCVWFCYILGNAKCLISTSRPDHRYYELTYDCETHEVYVDAYVKIKHSANNVG